MGEKKKKKKEREKFSFNCNNNKKLMSKQWVTVAVAVLAAETLLNWAIIQRVACKETKINKG
jgi:hypothetical protein